MFQLVKWVWLPLPIVMGVMSTLAPMTLAAEVTDAATQPIASSWPPIKHQQHQDNLAVSDEPTVMDQVTSVSQLTDVKPTDWAFQALQSLVERYGCIAGYPDQTYRGNRALTRYEFAAGLNACLDRVNELIAAATADLVKKEDLATLQKLQAEFAAELATLRGRVDALEARTATLEKQQFSTTTKLRGEAIFGLASVLTGQDATGADFARATTFSDRVRLNFDTSFSGKDLLRTRLQASNFDAITSLAGTGSILPEGTLAYNAELDDETPVGNTLKVEDLFYRFPLGDKTIVTLFANEGEVEDFVNTVNPFLDGAEGARGALSKFGSRNSVYYYVAPGAGVGVKHRFSDQLELSLGYLANTPNNPANRRGLFNGSYGAIAQVTFQPSNQLKLGLTYVNAYVNRGEDLAVPGTGSQKANIGLVTDAAVVTNAYGLEASYEVSPKFVVNAWATYANSRVVALGSADIWSYAIGLAFPDLGGRGNLGGIIVGMEPKVTRADAAIATAFIPLVSSQNATSAKDRDTSLHVEAFYTYALSDNISVTPGLIWLTAPNHDARNSDVLLGVLRTTFTF
jgi:Carbohydrate-selective porin, OprB family/S-layer homology domain